MLLEASLLVVVDDPAAARVQLQASVDAVLQRLVGSPRPLGALEDVFSSVQYVTPAQALETLTNKRDSAEQAASRVAIASKTGTTGASTSSGGSTLLSPADLAAARTLGPLTRRVSADALATVQAQCRDNDTPVRVVDFGQLAEAALKAAAADVKALSPNTPVAAQLTKAMQSQLEFSLQSEFQTQVDLLAEESFQAFRKSLSKLIIGPNLAADMQQVATSTLASFGKQAKRLVAPSASWSTATAHAALGRRLRESVTSRLAAARASGKFKPLPRKGVTIGLHWLLPKPFGNDYRQEPWLVHASDNLVYVPTDKVTEVSPEAVAAGDDWRNQVVPSPVGNDMVFMQ